MAGEGQGQMVRAIWPRGGRGAAVQTAACARGVRAQRGCSVGAAWGRGHLRSDMCRFIIVTEKKAVVSSLSWYATCAGGGCALSRRRVVTHGTLTSGLRTGRGSVAHLARGRVKMCRGDVEQVVLYEVQERRNAHHHGVSPIDEHAPPHLSKGSSAVLVQHHQKGGRNLCRLGCHDCSRRQVLWLPGHARVAHGEHLARILHSQRAQHGSSNIPVCCATCGRAGAQRAQRRLGAVCSHVGKQHDEQEPTWL